MSPLLEIQDLQVAYHSPAGGECAALAGVSFEVRAGEILGVLGESGSGKSTLGTALLKLLPPNGRIHKGSIRFEGQDLLQAQPRELQKIRGGRVSLIFQEPSMALHPTIRVGEQISDVISAHEPLDRRALREKTQQILAKVFSGDANHPAEAKGIPQAEPTALANRRTEVNRIAESYPHQLSGGQRQRVLLAQAIACSPALLIADEPTASLDPSTQQEILALLRTLREQLQCAVILITHNPALLQGLADRVLVLYAGKVAEIGPTEEILTSPHHPYTKALLKCLPPPIAAARVERKTKLTVIPGESPNLQQFANGCRYEPRCADRMDVCTATEPAETTLSERHAVACFRYGG